ncbi:MAG TPA: GNAT family N-acetyltransferase [Acidobacteriaceae bacterium]|nr:GNAT family N-acetyltransferase [Acidobacteriaceae bacterium]
MPTVVRTLTPADVPSAMELSKAANWNQTPEDWLRVLQLAGEGFRCVEAAGKIVATASLLPYGTRLAWIGMVLTRPENRRRGFARELMEDLIARAEGNKIRTLKLDATNEGRPLYESLGFIVEETVERWGRPAAMVTLHGCVDDRGAAIDSELKTQNSKLNKSLSDANRAPRLYAQNLNALSSSQPSLLKPSTLAPEQNRLSSSLDVDCLQISDAHFTMDNEAFGVSRKHLLEMLSQSGKCDFTSHGYVLSRPGATARYLGPCVADSEADAKLLIATHLEIYPNAGKSSDWYWDLLPANTGAVRCAEQLGFTRRRTLWRMRRGETMENDNAMVYAIAGFELG